MIVCYVMPYIQVQGDILKGDIWKWDVAVNFHSTSQFVVLFLRQLHTAQARSGQHCTLENTILRCLGLRCSGLRAPPYMTEFILEPLV